MEPKTANQKQYDKDEHCPSTINKTLTFSCVAIYDIRKSCYRWINVYSVLPSDPKMHLCQHFSRQKKV